MYQLRDLQERKLPQAEKENGFWVPARPFIEPLICRLKDAWQVVTGKADAFKWPHNQ